MRRCVSSLRRSPAKSCSNGCIRNCRIRPRSRPRCGKNCAVARSESSRRFTLSAKASAKSCSARPGRLSRRSGRRRARRSPKSPKPKFTCSCSSKCVKAGETIPTAIGQWDWNFPRIEAIRGACADRLAMQWTDDGIVLGVKRHGEANAIAELLTRGHGRHLGLVRGGFGSRLKPGLQAGNSVSALWRARLDEHLGNYTVEPVRVRTPTVFAAPHALFAVTHLASLARLLPER